MDIEKLVREYIDKTVHMSLATTNEGKPWVCEVHFAYDDALNIYFASAKDTRHAKEIADNPFVAGNIITQHHCQQKVRGVYFEGQAKALEITDEQHAGYKAYIGRLGGWDGMLQEISKDGALAMYQISVQNFYVFDAYSETRGKHQLPWGKKI